jgi:hypothetical protein
VSRNRKAIIAVTAIALLVALAAGVTYVMTASSLAWRVLWIAGPIGLTALMFAALEALLPRDGG